MTELLIGLALWIGAHLAKRMMPGIRRDMAKALGERTTRGVIAVVILVSVVLMVMGYRSMDLISIYTPFPGAGHLNNTLMFFALFAFGIGPAGGRLSAKIRHPMLWGILLWTVAHLLVNGDLASILLFGGVLGWAVVAMIGSNRRDGAWERPPKGSVAGLVRHGVFTPVVFAVIVAIHGPLLGVYPFPR